MGRNRKPVAMIEGHRTKKELAQRRQSEQAWRTGWPVECTDRIKRDPVALAQFERVIPLLERIGANDELFGNRIRRYCTTTSELEKTWKEADKLHDMARAATDPKAADKLERLANKFDRFALSLCRELSDFENEYGMTVISAQNFPKAEPPKPDPLLEILGY